jgi:hypothetical protein
LQPASLGGCAHSRESEASHERQGDIGRIARQGRSDRRLRKLEHDHCHIERDSGIKLERDPAIKLERIVKRERDGDCDYVRIAA